MRKMGFNGGQQAIDERKLIVLIAMCFQLEIHYSCNWTFRNDNSNNQ